MLLLTRSILASVIKHIKNLTATISVPKDTKSLYEHQIQKYFQLIKLSENANAHKTTKTND